MHAELPGADSHTDTLRAGCSHSVHFLVSGACARPLLWFRRRADHRVIGLDVGLDILARALIPRGNQPLSCQTWFGPVGSVATFPV